MNQKRYVAYYRVSTKKQNIELTPQKQAIKFFLKDKSPPEKEYEEIGSGRSQKPLPELAKALDYCKTNKATLVVAKLDRLSRDLEMIAGLLKNIDFVCCDMPEANRTTLGFMGVIAQWEREQIGKRTKEALAEKRKEGVLLGSRNPKVRAGLVKYWDKLSVKKEKKLEAQKQAKLAKIKRKLEGRKLKSDTPTKRELADKEILPTIKALRLQGLSYEKVADALNDTGIKTRWGKLWTQHQVIRVAKRNKL